MSLPGELAIAICFILALAAAIWQLVMALRGAGSTDGAQAQGQQSRPAEAGGGLSPARRFWQLVNAMRVPAPLFAAGLIGIALGIVIWQAASFLAATPAPTPDIVKLLEAERQARVADIARIDGTLKPTPSDLDRRLKRIETPHPPPLPPPPPPPKPQPSLTLDRLDVRLVKKGVYHLLPKTTPNTTDGTIQFASIDFCPPPGDDPKTCTPAPKKPLIGHDTTCAEHSFICNGSRGTFVTIPPAVVASAGCIYLSYTLKDGATGVAVGGPIKLDDPAGWPPDAKSEKPCKAPKP